MRRAGGGNDFNYVDDDVPHNGPKVGETVDQIIFMINNIMTS